MIKIEWYDTRVMCAIVADPDTAHSLVTALEESNYVRQWRVDAHLEEFPWYKECFWKNMKHDPSKWDYS